MFDPDVSAYTDAQLEAMILPSALTSGDVIGAARAELTKRQRAHELARDAVNRKHEVDIFIAQGNRDAFQQDFEERLAREQRAHAEKLANEQLRPAVSSATATRFAAIAAVLSAVAAIASAAVGYLSYIR